MIRQNTAAVRLELSATAERHPATKADALPRDFLREDHGGILDSVRLLGQPSLAKYTRFVQEKTVNGAGIDRGGLVAEWRAAKDYYQELEETESGIADEIEIRELDPALTPLVEEAMVDPRFTYAFKTFETRFEMVELDRLVLFQTNVTQQGADRLKEQLPAEPDPAALLRFCLPAVVPEPPVKMRQVGSSRFVFTCESTDFRRHDPVLLRPDQIDDYQSFGPISGVVGLVVGFSSNFLTGVRQGDDGRVLLKNGYHRAYAMRDMGITHAPCIIQTVTSRDELSLAVSSKVAQNLDFYFASARPPMLRDFFDPRIRKVFQIYKTLKMIEIEFDVSEYYVGA